MRQLRFAFALMLATTGCSFGTDPSVMFHVHGVVIDRTTSLPAATVRVKAYYAGGCGVLSGNCWGDETIKMVVTDSQGRFSIDFDPGHGVCLPFYVAAADFPSTEGYYGSVNDCEDKGKQLQLTILITRQ